MQFFFPQHVPSSPTIPHPQQQHPSSLLHPPPSSIDSAWTLTSLTRSLSPRLAPSPKLPSTLFQNERHAHNIETIPPHGPSPPTTQGHPMPRTFHSDREHDTGPLHLRLPCAPPNSSMPPSSIHHICPPASITSPQRQQTQRKEKAKKRREEYGRYHAEQCWPEYRLLSRALPLLAWTLLHTHPLLQGNNSPEARGMEPGCGAI